MLKELKPENLILSDCPFCGEDTLIVNVDDLNFRQCIHLKDLNRVSTEEAIKKGQY